MAGVGWKLILWSQTDVRSASLKGYSLLLVTTHDLVSTSSNFYPVKVVGRYDYLLVNEL